MFICWFAVVVVVVAVVLAAVVVVVTVVFAAVAAVAAAAAAVAAAVAVVRHDVVNTVAGPCQVGVAHIFDAVAVVADEAADDAGDCVDFGRTEVRLVAGAVDAVVDAVAVAVVAAVADAVDGVDGDTVADFASGAERPAAAHSKKEAGFVFVENVDAVAARVVGVVADVYVAAAGTVAVGNMAVVTEVLLHLKLKQQCSADWTRIQHVTRNVVGSHPASHQVQIVPAAVLAAYFRVLTYVK
eukprot:TRINITY_DN23220_c0_g3_i1.p2 TRINITY_DN23220_c0_g3~~TRINITY_DN23220_c0_g3_i1.p2  ORF type:complete len:241 (-),score=89.60 TRINITY_DN23220_c0_g3_i1:209-931(-)